MTSTVQEVAQNATGAATSASNADASAQKGREVMQNTITTINALSQEVTSASDVIRKLEEDTSSVGTVLDVIRGIAEQTNLLALNAAIEAARAGEAAVYGSSQAHEPRCHDGGYLFRAALLKTMATLCRTSDSHA